MPDKSGFGPADVVSTPGLYIQEATRAVPPIAGAPTAVAAFVGHTAAGPVSEPVQVTSFAGFETVFGGLESGSALGYAVRHFFMNGGGPAWIVRVAAAAAGQPPGAAEMLGDRAAATGLYALQRAEGFNLLNLPDVSDAGVLSQAIAFAAERRAMVLVDLPATVATVGAARDWITDPVNAPLRHPNAVAYFPRVQVEDPLQGGQLRSVANAGAVAGLYARNDLRRGVWKAAAGPDAPLFAVAGLDVPISDTDNAVLNPLAVNCLRSFPAHGVVPWGARTLAGMDAMASDWKYVPVRRTALYIEESLDRGTRFAVFEPNGEPLWARLRQSIGDFMHRLFREGAFQGSKPEEGYLVRCDAATTTQADIDQGVVNILVGFAPLKPAEFVILHIRQIAGQAQEGQACRSGGTQNGSGGDG